MYAIEDKESIIRDIQEYLTLISGERDDEGYNPKQINGVFDEDTKSAVIYYQRSEGYPDSGVVDSETFYNIYNDYLYHTELVRRREKYPVVIDFPVGYGASHKDMVKINSMLYNVSEYYYGASDIRKNSYFSQNTEMAVKALREVFGLPESEFIDEEFYYFLSEENFLINQRKENIGTAF